MKDRSIRTCGSVDRVRWWGRMTAIMVVYPRKIVTENMKSGFTEGLGCRSLLLVIVVRAATVKTMKSAVDTKELAAQAKNPLRQSLQRLRDGDSSLTSGLTFALMAET